MFDGLSSASVCVAVSVWEPTAALLVVQLNDRLVLAPAANPATLCVPMVPPADASLRTIVNAPAFCAATFCTVTVTVAVPPFMIDAGAVIPVTATSSAGAFTLIAVDAWLFAALSSANDWLATSVCVPKAAPAVDHQDAQDPH